MKAIDSKDSKEHKKKQNVNNNSDLKEKAIVDKFKKKSRKLCLFKIFTVLFMILIVSTTIIVVYVLFKDKNHKTEVQNEEKNNDIENIEEIERIEEINSLPLKIMGRNNSIIGVYLLEKGKEATIFNPEKINLEEKNYNIEIISQSIHENNNNSS